jgi:hypothetical protein
MDDREHLDDREQRIREIAHRLWEEEGRPPDQEKRHWEAAERRGPRGSAASCHYLTLGRLFLAGHTDKTRSL